MMKNKTVEDDCEENLVTCGSCSLSVYNDEDSDYMCSYIIDKNGSSAYVYRFYEWERCRWGFTSENIEEIKSKFEK